MSLSPQARALLDAARGGLTPPPDALLRVRGRVDAAVAGSSAALVAKLSLVVVVAAVLAGAIAVGHKSDAAVPHLSFSESLLPIETPRVTERTNDITPPPYIDIAAEPKAANVAIVVEPQLAAPQPGAAQGVKPVALSREVELVDAAMTALKAGDNTTALASVRVHREETHGKGQLAEDAAAIEIEALCKLHDKRVVDKLEAFDERWPDSAQRSRLKTNCP